MGGNNYSKFEATTYDLNHFSGRQPGRKAPDATLASLSDVLQRLLDFTGNFLVLETGSITCPLFQGRRGGMAKPRQQFPDTIFAIPYVREAHPGEIRPKHKSEVGKIANAQAPKPEDEEGRMILIGSPEGAAWGFFSSLMPVWKNPVTRTLRLAMGHKAPLVTDAHY